jgi:thioesterase domain-containing protein/predicted NAD/FAD-dependent oxidoreductase/acyl carrier protein
MTDQRYPVAAGLDDPRFYDVDADFAAVLGELTAMMKMSRVTRARFFHRTATTAAGTLRVLDDPDVPAHRFFRPGRVFPVIARYSNANVGDDMRPDARGVTLRLLDDPVDVSRGLFDLTLNTGECFFARTADVFRRYAARGAEREEVLREDPARRAALWDIFRTPVSFAAYDYHSQIPRAYVAEDGRQWLVRYRLVAPDGEREPGQYDPGDRDCPPDPPDELPRLPGESRSATYLHDELRARVSTEGVYGVLQVQLRPVDEEGLDCSRPWPQTEYPYRDLAQLRLDSLVPDDAVEPLSLSVDTAPPDLGIMLARTPHEAASTNHLRALLYRMGSVARRGESLPAELESLLRNAPPRSRTVCVIGAGPGGLTMARELERGGHRVVVLEERDDIGGKCDSVEIDRRAYDLGGHVCTTRYERLAAMAAELGVTTEDTTVHRVLRLADGSVRPQDTSFFRRETYQRYAELRAARFPRIGEPGLDHSARALAQPVTEWLAEHGLQSLADSLAIGYTAAGYGPLAGDLPALYFVKYAELTGLLSSRPELLGHTGSFTIAGGFKGLWQKVAAGLADVRTGVRVTGITRGSGGVRVDTDQGPVEADELVLAVPLNRVLPVLDATAEERDLAARIRYMDYYTTIVTATGLPRSAFYLIEENTAPGTGAGRCVAMHHRYADRDEYACYSYGGDGLDGEDIVRLLAEDIERLGGRLEKVHLQRRWTFLPHFGSADLAYHAGSLPGYELVEPTIGHAQELARRWFDVPAPAEVPLSEDAGPVGGRAPVTAAGLREWLVSHVAAELRRPESAIDATAPLDSYALDSLSVAALQAELSDHLGFRVPHTLFLELPSLDAVAHRLAELDGRGAGRADDPSAPDPGPRSRSLLGLGAVRPFFCVGGAVGAAYYLRPLARALGHRQPFYGLQAPGYDGTEEPLDDIGELARYYLDQIRLVQPYGPYTLGGHSFGGLVAYEMARQLRAEGEAVSQVVLLDCFVPVPGRTPPPPDPSAALAELLAMDRRTNGVPEAGATDEVQRLAGTLGADGTRPVEEHLANVIELYQANLEAVVRYQPPAADLPVTLIKAAGGFPPVQDGERAVALHVDDPHNGWERVGLPALTVIEVPGDHFSMLAEPHLETLAETLDRVLHPPRWPATPSVPAPVHPVHVVRRRRAPILLAALAALGLAVGGPVAGMHLRAQSPAPAAVPAAPAALAVAAPAGQLLTATDPVTHVRAALTVQARAWGTQADLELRGVNGPQSCQLLAVTRSGQTTVMGGWRVPPPGYGVPTHPAPLVLQGATDVARTDIDHFVVRTTDGHNLVTIPA